MQSRLCLLGLLVAVAAAPVSGTIIVPKLTANQDSLVKHVINILLKAFRDPFEATLIRQKASSPDGGLLHASIISKVVEQLRGLIVMQFTNPVDGTFRRPNNRIGFLVDSYEAYELLFREFTAQQNGASGKILIVHSGRLNESIARLIFDDLWRQHIINAVLLGNTELGVQLWSYVPYVKGSCGLVNLIRLEASDPADTLYPDKTKSFHGFPFKVGSFETRPFTIMQFSENGTREVSGFEGDLLDVLSKRLSFEVTIVEPGNGEQWGYALKENSTGLMGMIQREEVDFGISCLGISVARIKILKAGIAHYTTALVLAVPKGRRYSSLEKLILPFKKKVWYFLAIFVLGAIVVICLVEYKNDDVRNFVYGRNIRSPYLNLLQVLFGITIHLTPSRNFARTLLFLWMIHSMVLRTCYQGSMYRFLQRKSTLPPSQTLNEIDQTGALYYVVESGERYYEAFPHRYQRVRHLPQEHNNIIRRLKWMMSHPRSPDVVQGALDHIAYHNRLYRKRGGFQLICPEFISTFTVAIFYPKRSILMEQFDNKIQHIQASGLMSFWVTRYGDYDFRRPKKTPRPKRLNNRYLVFAYQMGAILLIASGVVF
ncbi:uncharacterized protein LOC129728901 [Wyeomyia smithii]|uniref:uncharacterized protein LOC129728901 n=1 Tax=Wyeomyia smithii TaxID=174621 RepID=UPI002467D640|nr:uncharacterized protein LOC129728901 [Wyeomyia smithii]